MFPLSFLLPLSRWLLLRSSAAEYSGLLKTCFSAELAACAVDYYLHQPDIRDSQSNVILQPDILCHLFSGVFNFLTSS